jgi:hypothetical protein
LISDRDIEVHPFIVVKALAARHGDDVVFYYSRYKIAQTGQQAAALRTYGSVTGRHLTETWLALELSRLAADEELAWHSTVQVHNARRHMPMIDFVGQPSPRELASVTEVLSQDRKRKCLYFDSGRSCHGYCEDLIEESDWVKYLGRLLLLNTDVSRPIIDHRWVGHALIRGFAALRWSHNTARYRALPRLIQTEALVVSASSQS